MTITNFKLDVAIEEALVEFMALEGDNRNSLNMMLLARKYAPRTANHIVSCLTDQPALLFAEAKGGYLLADDVTATIGDIIASAMMSRFTDEVKTEQAETIRRESLRQSLSVVRQ